MIKKLQRRLTLLLSSVSIFLLLFLLIFPFLFNRYTLYSSLKTALTTAVNSPMHDYNSSGSYPVFIMLVNSDSEVIDSNGPDFFLDADTKSKIAKDAISKINDGEKLFSSINGGKIAYLCKKDVPPDNFEDKSGHFDNDKHSDSNDPNFKDYTLYRIAVTDFGNVIKSLQRLRKNP